ETVLVQKNWREHIGCGGRRGGYLGYGLYKYAFEGKIQEKDFALFEWKEVCCQFNEENFNKLGSELVLLAWGEYFAESFNEWIRSSSNTKDTFIGKLVDEVKDATDSSQNSSLVEPSIRWNAFLAPPLLPKPTREAKFSGNEQAGSNTDRLGMCVDAFAHHTVIDSVGEFLFANLQGNFDQTSGPWDKGAHAIQNFLNTHKCNDICHSIGL
ncbi:hypothetical protein BU17DRAFT_15904, partial [Hysterangium stoloniferum]